MIIRVLNLNATRLLKYIFFYIAHTKFNTLLLKLYKYFLFTNVK